MAIFVDGIPGYLQLFSHIGDRFLKAEGVSLHKQGDQLYPVVFLHRLYRLAYDGQAILEYFFKLRVGGIADGVVQIVIDADQSLQS